MMTVSRGDDLPNKARELAHHFSTQGTPIMIGDTLHLSPNPCAHGAGEVFREARGGSLKGLVRGVSAWVRRGGAGVHVAGSGLERGDG